MRVVVGVAEVLDQLYLQAPVVVSDDVGGGDRFAIYFHSDRGLVVASVLEYVCISSSARFR